MRKPSCPRCSGMFKLSDGDLLCIQCGHLIQREVIPVAPMPGPPAKITPQLEIHPLVIKYQHSIKRIRKSGGSWLSIVRMIFVAEKVRLHIKTIQRHFVRLQHEA